MELRIEKVRKDFDRFPALDGVSLDIRSGRRARARRRCCA